MSFLNLGSLGNVWTSWGTGRSFDLLGDAWRNLSGSAKSYAAGIVNLWHGAWDDDGQFGTALGQFLSRPAPLGSTQTLRGLGSGVMGLIELPVIKQVAGTAMWAQNEFVKRPLTTMNLVQADAWTGRGSVISGQAWRTAYNMSDKVTVGQSYMFKTSAQSGVATRALGGQDTLTASIDPRDRAKQEQFYKNPWLKGVSGSIDFFVTAFMDPTIVLGKLGLAGKAKFLSKPMTAGAIRSGSVQAYVDSANYNKLHEFMANASSAEVAHQRVWASHRSGDKAAALLWGTAQDRQVYDHTFRALYGDVDSWAWLTANAPRVASVTGRTYANQTIARVANRAGQDAGATSMVNALGETETRAFVDAIANGRGAFGAARGSQIGQNLPRLTLTSKWRTNVHNKLTFGPAVFLGSPIYPVASRLRYIMPTARYTRFLDLNDAESVNAFRSSLERSPLPREELEGYVSQYGRATSAESRAQIAGSAEDAAFGRMAERHGFTTDEVQRALPEINRWRVGNRQVLASARRFMSNDAARLAEDYIRGGRAAEALNAQALSRDIQTAVERGDQPLSSLHLLDEDGNNVILPERFQVAVDRPVTISQMADLHIMQDWRVLDSALWWQRHGALGSASFKALESGKSLLDAVNTAWKLTALVRPGYVWRMLSDDVLRRSTLYGAFPVAMATSRGVANSARNWAARYGTVGERRSAVQAARGLNRTDVPRTAIVQSAMPSTNLAEDIPGVGRVYGSHEAALADGVRSVDDYLRQVSEGAANGTLPQWLAMTHQGYLDGCLSASQYRNIVVDQALRSQGRAAYAEPAWQAAFADELERLHVTRPQGQPGVNAIVDPFTGATPTRVGVADYSLTGGASFVRGETGFDPEDVYNYIAAHRDELLMPRSILHAQVTPDGQMRLSVGTAGAHVTEPVRATGGHRIKFLGYESRTRNYRETGHERLSITTPQGPIVLEAAFDGASGARFRAQASSRGPREAWVDSMADTEYGRLVNATRGHVEVSPDAANYGESWERAVNLQLGNDPVARMFLDGKTVDDVLNWVRNTSEGRAYHGRMGPWQSRYVEQVQTVRALVDSYVPDVGNLRQRVLTREARYSDLEANVTRQDMPVVHGAALDVAIGGRWSNTIRKWADRTFKVLSDMPADKASRFPFFAERYRAHAEDIVRGAQAQYAAAGRVMPATELEHVQQLARTRALADVKKYLYDTSASQDVAAALRLAVPFASAAADSFYKWGVIVRQGGTIPPVLNLWKLWTTPDRNGLVVDEEGNVKHWSGTEFEWYSVNPKTSEQTRLPEGHAPKHEYIVFQLPSGLQPETASGAKMVSYINKDTFNTFLGLPTAGPLIAIPANEFALKIPELNDNVFVRKFILPFGPSADVWKTGVPANVRNAWELAFGSVDESTSTRGIAQAVLQTEYTRYVLGERSTPPTMAEVKEAASDLRGLQFLSQFMGMSTQLRSPYQPFIDYYHQLQAKDPENALARFYDEMGEEYRMLTASVSRNMLGLPASVATAKQQEKFRDLIAKFPDLASLIVGAEGAGEFSSAVYQAQLQQSIAPGSNKKVREILSLEESASDAERRYLWVKYGKLMDSIHADLAQRGLSSLNQKGARDLKKARDAFIDANMYWVDPQGARRASPWYEDFMSSDGAAMTDRLTSMAQLVQDKRLANRDDIRGLMDYLVARLDARAEMSARGFATLDSAKAARFRSQWDAYVFGLKDSNLSFASLYDRWLTTDNLSTDFLVGGSK